MEAPDLEAPSPTFTLMQVYEAPRAPVVHADFYRLRSALELDNIGWDEALIGAIAIVEWPERVAAALPADRLDVTIRFDPARGPDFRVLELRGRGTVGRRLSRALGVGALLKRTGWDEARRDFLQGDASVRAYERLTRADGGAAILMISPPRPDGPILRYGKPYAAIAKLSPDIRAFIAMADGLRAVGYSAPGLIGYSIEEGLALIEDFGAETVVEDGVPNVARYAEAIALLVDLHGRDLPDALPAGEDLYRLPTYDIEAMLVEVELALDWYAPAIARVAVPSGARMQFLAHWRELLSPILAQRTTWTLRDYHSPNLHWLAGEGGLRQNRPHRFSGRSHRPPGLRSRVAAAGCAHRRIRRSRDAAGGALCPTPQGGRSRLRRRALCCRLRGDGRPASDKNPRDSSPVSTNATASRSTSATCLRIERYLAKNLAHPLLRPLALWYQTHLPRALGPPPEEPPAPQDPRSDRR